MPELSELERRMRGARAWFTALMFMDGWALSCLIGHIREGQQVHALIQLAAIVLMTVSAVDYRDKANRALDELLKSKPRQESLL